MKHSPLYLGVFLLFIVFSLAACSTGSTSLPVSDSRIINQGSSFGQSFTSQNNGLSGISVLLAPIQTQSAGSLLLHLRTSPQSTDDLVSARLPLSEITRQAYYKFDIPPQSDSQLKDYYFQVEVEGEGQVQIFTAAADSYLDGALYENQIPQDAQLGFLLEYEFKAYLLGLTHQAIKWVGVLLVGLFAFILPGWALFSFFWRGWQDLPWGAKFGLSGGLSLAIYPLFILWTSLVGFHLGPIYAWLPPLVGLLTLTWKNRKSLVLTRLSIRQKFNLREHLQQLSAGNVIADIGCIVIIGLVIVSRLWVIRSLDVPLFRDSYQHTMITQLIIDHSGLFNSWEPYADLTSFTYHFGFHSAAAVFHWISGASAPRSVLWTGQLINVIAILGLYPLAFKIAKNRWAGVIAMLIAGLLSSMPMYYVNWGRYTQLAGQAILPVAIWTAWELLDIPFLTLQNSSWFRIKINWRSLGFGFGSIAITWLALGGVAITHYRILILAILFFPAYALITFSRKNILDLIGRIIWIGIGGAILFAPWFLHISGGKILEIFADQITTLPSALSTTMMQTNYINNITFYLPLSICVLSVLCIGLGLWKRKKELLIFNFWWILIVLATNPSWIGLPGTGLITNFAIYMAFYIPASVIVGSASEWIILYGKQIGRLGTSMNKWNISKLLLPCMALVVICIIGIRELPNSVNVINIPTHALITRPDLRAMAWIRENLSTDAIFLINGYFMVNDTLVVGSDGGWWIPILTGRKTSLPPFTYSFEDSNLPNNLEATNNLVRVIQDKGVTNPEIITLLNQHSIKYLYIGQHQCNVGYTGPQLLDPKSIVINPMFKVVYHQDRVWIFEVVQ
jgi:hypothetical protein